MKTTLLLAAALSVVGTAISLAAVYVITALALDKTAREADIAQLGITYRAAVPMTAAEVVGRDDLAEQVNIT